MYIKEIPLSRNFNTVMVTLRFPESRLATVTGILSLQQHQVNEHAPVSRPDDTSLVVSGPTSYQEMLQRVEGWLDWSVYEGIE